MKINLQYQRIEQLIERKKELECIYRVDAVLKDISDIHQAFSAIVNIIPEGFQFPDYTKVEIQLQKKRFRSSNFFLSRHQLVANIVFAEENLGQIRIYCENPDIKKEQNPFLCEEQLLINAIASRIGHSLFNHLLLNGSTKSSPPDEKAYWNWRMQIVDEISELVPAYEMGIKAIYLIGSTKNATAGINSDIDLIIHYSGITDHKLKILNYFKGWSQALALWNKTMHMNSDTSNLIDLHLITDADIMNKSSYAVKINAPTDPAKLIKIYY